MSKTKVGKRRRHPWDKWFGYRQFVLKKGRQYTCQSYTMAQQVRNAAAERDMKVSIRILHDRITVTVWSKTTGTACKE